MATTLEIGFDVTLAVVVVGGIHDRDVSPGQAQLIDPRVDLVFVAHQSDSGQASAVEDAGRLQCPVVVGFGKKDGAGASGRPLSQFFHDGGLRSYLHRQ